MLMASTACTLSSVAQQPADLRIDLTSPMHSVSPMLYGLMTEEINYSYDGGIYAEMVRNRTFDDAGFEGLQHCRPIEMGHTVVTFKPDRTDGPSATLPRSLRVEVKSASPEYRGACKTTATGAWRYAPEPALLYQRRLSLHKLSRFARASTSASRFCSLSQYQRVHRGEVGDWREKTERHGSQAVDDCAEVWTEDVGLARRGEAERLVLTRQLAIALDQFERERAINPSFPPLYEFLGDLYTKLGQKQKAQLALTEALSLDQSRTGPFILMGKLFLEDNDPQTAASYLGHAEQMDPSNFTTHSFLGQAYRKMGKKDDAKPEFNAV
jgi:hypothetical protein